VSERVRRGPLLPVAIACCEQELMRHTSTQAFTGIGIVSQVNVSFPESVRPDYAVCLILVEFASSSPSSRVSD
jgi:hypothetical protein